MNAVEFNEAYKQIGKRVTDYSEKARREGLLSLEDLLDKDKIKERDIFEYGMRFVIDGTDRDIIDKILSNIVNQEKNESLALLKTIQKEAVLAIQNGDNPMILRALLNSYTNMTLEEDELIEKSWLD